METKAYLVRRRTDVNKLLAKLPEGKLAQRGYLEEVLKEYKEKNLAKLGDYRVVLHVESMSQHMQKGRCTSARCIYVVSRLATVVCRPTTASDSQVDHEVCG